MIEEYFSIGKICKKTGISVPTLRYYESLGLIKPARIDENTGYRYYSSEHFWEIEIIKLCKKIGFPLKMIKAMQQNQNMDELLDFISIQKFRIRKELMKYTVMMDDIEWLEKLWKNISEKEKCDIFLPEIKELPERKVIMTHLSDDNNKKLRDQPLRQMPILQMQIQILAAKELDSALSIKSNYGYELDFDSIKQGKINLKSEYVEFPKYNMTIEKKLEIIPKGKYLCIDTRLFTDMKWIEILKEYIEKNNLKPKRIFAAEVSLYFFDWRNTYHEIQILL